MKYIAYEYKNCPIPGGGFVTGLLFARGCEDMYARTDIGGLYRRDFEAGRWIPLNDDVTSERLAATYPLSIASDEAHPGRLYAVCGTYREEHGYLMVSHDRGESFLLKPLPCRVHGNTPGRSAGERLLSERGILYFASQTAGLWRSDDEGGHWQQLFVRESGAAQGNGAPASGTEQTVHTGCMPEQNLTFVWKRDKLLVVGCNGAANRISDEMRGASLYISRDAGEHFAAMPQPQSAGGFSGIAGFVPQRCCFDGRYLYVTFLETEGSHYGGMDCYSFDTGACHDGRVWRYEILSGEASSKEILAEDITPCGERILTDGLSPEEKRVLTGLVPPEYREAKETDEHSQDLYGACVQTWEQARAGAGRMLSGGVSGIDCCGGMLLCSTGGIKGQDAVFASMDAGEHWLPVLCGLSIGNFRPETVSYMKPEYNGGRAIIHWLADIKINPHRPDEAYFTTGTGIFRCSGLDAVRQALGGAWTGESRARLVSCYPDCAGLEETVHLNVYSFPEGPVRVLDIVGDLGGFAFRNPEEPCENSFADEHGSRYITCLNADFPEQYPNMLATGARGNWTGTTKGGALLSYDQGQHFVHLPYPEGISEKLDALIEEIKRPNVNAGYVAVSADGTRVLWAVAQRRGFASDCTVYMDITPCAMRTTEAEIYADGMSADGAEICADGVSADGAEKCADSMSADGAEIYADGMSADGVQKIYQGAGNARRGAWKSCSFYDRKGEPLSQPVSIHLYADRIKPEWMYAFADGGRIFLSADKGERFYETEQPEGFPKALFSHWSVNCQVTADYTEAGVLYLAVQESGLYRLKLRGDLPADLRGNGRRLISEGAAEDAPERFGERKIKNNAENVRESGRRGSFWELACLTAPGDYARCVGLGRGYAQEKNGDCVILYIAGRIGGTYGFYRSQDRGRTWERINSGRQMFGEIRAVCGDRREAGVFYLASGSRGLLCGKPKF